MTSEALSPIGLGCSRIGSFNNPQSLKESEALVRAALDLGVTTLDTSNIYGQGDSERVIGRVLRGQRDRAFVITKTGRKFSAKMRLLNNLKPLLRPLLASRGGSGNVVTARRGSMLQTDWTPARFAPSLDASLKRLGTGHVDAFLLHSPPPEVAADPVVGDVLRNLRDAGKVRHFGVSCDDLETLEAALSMDGLSVLQLPWDVIQSATHLVARIAGRGIIILAREVIALQPALPPIEAVRASLTHPLVSCTLVGTTKLENLTAIAAAGAAQ